MLAPLNERFRQNIPNASLRYWSVAGTTGSASNLSVLANVSMLYEAIDGMHYGKFLISAPLAAAGYLQPGDVISITKATWTAYNCTRKPIEFVNKATGYAYIRLEFPDDTETGCTVYAHIPFSKIVISGVKPNRVANTGSIYIGSTPLGLHTIAAINHPIKITAGSSYTLEVPDGAQCDLSQLSFSVDTDNDCASVIAVSRQS